MIMFKRCIAIAAIISAGFFSSAQAQNTDTDKKPKEVQKETSAIDDLAQHAEQFAAQFEKLKEKFALSEDQASQIKSIITDNAMNLISDYVNIQTASKADRPPLIAAFQKNIADIKEKVFGILTPAQRTEAEKLFKEGIKSINKEKKRDLENGKKEKE
jgi:hypothetical protein